jgi:hypothetical protein
MWGRRSPFGHLAPDIAISDFDLSRDGSEILFG